MPGPASIRDVNTLILAGGDAPVREYLEAHWPSWSEDIGLVIAADGGARHAPGLGLMIDLWVGDGDSIDPAALAALRDAHVEIERSPAEKDETDTELAIRAALARGAAGLVVIGATGGPRIDHEIANLALLAIPELEGMEVTAYTPTSKLTPLRGPAAGRADRSPGATVAGRDPGIISLVPLRGDAVGVTTRGLRYPLHDETLSFGAPRGISNESDGPWEVRLRGGLLLVIETPATIGR